MSAVQSRARWLVRRLRAMPPAEVVARSRRTARHRGDDLLRRAAPDAWRRSWQPRLDASALAAGRGPAGLLSRERAEGLVAVAPQEPARIMARADRFLRGEIQFFGYPSVQLELPIDYWLDPHAKARWPDRHGKQVDYRHMASGDPKWIWELNRCQELPILIQAWLLSGEQSYALAARDEALRWSEQNPPGRGVSWVNGYEAGLRAISLSMTYAALRHEQAPMSSAERSGWLRLLWQHGRWIRRDPSTHSSANNHRIGELVGLLVLAALAPELPQAESWLGDAKSELALEAARQILPDGVGAEQAFTYHLYVIDLLLVAVATLDATGRLVAPALLAALERSGRALWAQIGAGEPPLSYGDTDDGVALRLDAGELRGARSLAAAIAARVESPCARSVAGAYDAGAWWLFGPDGRARFQGTRPAGDPGDAYLPDGGLVVLRRGSARITVDVGPLGYLSLAAHGHSDALALTLTVGSTELVTDPGTGSYFRSAEVREAFRATGFHATVEVDGVSQSEPGGPFLWSRHAHVRDVLVDLPRATVSASQDGYLQLADPVAHRRTVRALGERALLVIDRLRAEQAHSYRQLWPFHKDAEVRIEQPTRLVAVGSTARLSLCFAASPSGEVELDRGRRSPLRGWWSGRLESWEPAFLGSVATAGAGVVLLVALLGWAEQEQAMPACALELTEEIVVAIVDGRRYEIDAGGAPDPAAARR